MNLRCPYCSCRFSARRMPLIYISCGHTFCEDCIKNMFETYNSFSCAKCEVSTSDTKCFLYNRIILEHFETPQPIESEPNHLIRVSDPPFFEPPSKSPRFTLNWPPFDPKTAGIRDHPIWQSHSRTAIFSEKKRSSNFVSHFATKAKIHRNKFFNESRSKARPRTPVRNRHYKPENSPNNRSRSVSKNKILPKQFTFEEHEPEEPNNALVWNSSNARSKTNKVVVNANFKPKKAKGFTQKQRPRRWNWWAERACPGLGRSTPRRSGGFGKQFVSISSQQRVRRDSDTAGRSRKSGSKILPGDDKSAYRDRNSSNQDFISAQSILRREFENMLDLKKSEPAKSDPLNKLEIDSLFDSNSNAFGNQMLRPCTFPQCHNRSAQAFCSIECFEQFQRLYYGKQEWSPEASKENRGQGILEAEKNGKWVDRDSDLGQFMGHSIQRQLDGLALPNLERVKREGPGRGSGRQQTNDRAGKC